MRLHRATAVVAGSLLVLSTGPAGASREAAATASAAAIAIQVLVPGQTPAIFGNVATPPDAAVTNGTIIYPADASVVNATTVSESAAAKEDSAAAGVDAGPLLLFGGEITADSLAARASAHGASGDFTGSTLTNLVVLGQPVQPVPNARLQLGDWGHAVVLGQTTTQPGASYRGALLALEVVLDATHGGLPAGSRIQLGFVQVASSSPAPTPPASTAKAPPAAPATTSAKPQPAAKPGLPKAKQRPAVRKGPHRATPAKEAQPKPEKAKKAKKATKRKVKKKVKKKSQPLPKSVHPNLGEGLYVFPVYGPAGYGNTYAADRSDVTYHHGDDVFAPLGAPVLAVADGTIFSVGWEKLGGNRLWLRDRHGNEFYYAHLAAYSTLAVNGTRVHAGDVIGFVGNTGDADGTEYHLHFEVHPVSFLFLGYDGAVDPTKYLDRWRRLREIRLRPAVGGGPPLGGRSGPPPGAVLLQSVDISTASGLEPRSLERAVQGLR